MFFDPNMIDSNERVLLHLGCGPFVQPTRWIDCDGSWNARVNSWPKPLASLLRRIAKKAGGGQRPLPGHIRYFDLRKRFPFADGGVDAIYAAHVWEHLTFSVATHATRECFRVLRPGGIIRLVVPNVRDVVSRYLDSKCANAALELNKKLYYKPLKEGSSLVYALYASLNDFHYHKFMYDPPQLELLLSECGFVKIKLRGFLDSEIHELEDIESEHRIGIGKGFCMEASKPTITSP